MVDTAYYCNCLNLQQPGQHYAHALYLLSAKVPECQKIEKDGLDQYGAEHFDV